MQALLLLLPSNETEKPPRSTQTDYSTLRVRAKPAAAAQGPLEKTEETKSMNLLLILDKLGGWRGEGCAPLFSPALSTNLVSPGISQPHPSPLVQLLESDMPQLHCKLASQFGPQKIYLQGLKEF